MSHISYFKLPDINIFQILISCSTPLPSLLVYISHIPRVAPLLCYSLYLSFHSQSQDMVSVFSCCCWTPFADAQQHNFVNILPSISFKWVHQAWKSNPVPEVPFKNRVCWEGIYQADLRSNTNSAFSLVAFNSVFSSTITNSHMCLLRTWKEK